MNENRARDSRSSGRFREGHSDNERSTVGAVDDNASSDEDVEVCVAE
jgi:hypothetical protein